MKKSKNGEPYQFMTLPPFIKFGREKPQGPVIKNRPLIQLLPRLERYHTTPESFTIKIIIAIPSI